MIQMKDYSPNGWRPSVVLTEAVNDKGVEELAEAVFKHREFLIDSGELETRRKQRAKIELIEAIENSLMDYIYQRIDKDDWFEKLVDDLVQRKINPHSAAEKVIRRFGIT